MAELVRYGLFSAALLCASAAAGFPHVVREGESPGQIAERVYGRVDLERLIVAANALDERGSNAVVPGMRLEVPAVGYHNVLPSETWQTIAAELLGSAKRGDVLAELNGLHPWVQPELGKEIMIPFNLSYVASQGDTTEIVAYRFLGHRDMAWVIASYNDLKRARLRQGETLLVPLSDLSLSAEGKREAMNAEALVRTQAGGQALEAQRQAEAKIPMLVADVRRGRYVEAIRRGEGLLASAALSQPQLAVIYRQLVEAYVALDATGLASTACAEWRHAEPQAVLDPIELSPKIVRACTGEGMPTVAPSSPALPPGSARPVADAGRDPGP